MEEVGRDSDFLFLMLSFSSEKLTPTIKPAMGVNLHSDYVSTKTGNRLSKYKGNCQCKKGKKSAVTFLWDASFSNGHFISSNASTTFFVSYLYPKQLKIYMQN